MPQITLPPELHELVIGVYGDQLVVAVTLGFMLRRDVRATLGACALVCKHWHAFTLRYTFYGVWICQDRRSRAHFALLTELIKTNPYIKQCIRDTDLKLPAEFDTTSLENMCRVISPIETLRIYNTVSTSTQNLSRASTLDSLRPILVTPHLRDLTLYSRTISTRLLEVLHSVQSLSLQGVRMVVVDHGLKGQDSGTRRHSALRKLVLHPAEFVLASIGAAVESDRELFGFFENIRSLELSFEITRLGNARPWNAMLARWSDLEKLEINWIVNGESVSYHRLSDGTSNAHLAEPGDRFLISVRAVPWTSFKALRSLTFCINDQGFDPKLLVVAVADASTTFFAGPSRLQQLRHMHFTYKNCVEYEGKEDDYLDLQLLDAIYHSSLNRTIANDPNNFPALKSFYMELVCSVMLRKGLSAPSQAQIAQLLEDRLPAIYGPGGRRESEGWAMSIEAIVHTSFTVS